MPDGSETNDKGLYFQPSYDRANENQLEWDITNMIGALQEFSVRNTKIIEGKKHFPLIYDSEAIGRIRRMFSTGKLILLKYKEDEAVEKVNMVLDFLTDQYALDTKQTIQNLELLSDLIARHLGQEQQFKDKTHAKFIWDSELKKKLEILEMLPEHQEFYSNIQGMWRKLAFIITYYVVVCGGDAHILLSGPNNSGKTNTALSILAKCNWYLVNYWKVKRYNEVHTKEHPELADVPQRRFSIKKDVYVTTEAHELQDRFKAEQYQCIDINEGMEVATNMQSQRADAVQVGVKRYTSRSYHNIVVWEYQVQQRPTAMMVEGMNFWIQKMRKRHFVLSVASTLVRKKDPYYFHELNKCRKERDISFWMKYLNPNYIATFKAPKLKERYVRIFQNHYWEQKNKQQAAEQVKRHRTQDYELMIADVWEKINVRHTLSLVELESEVFQKLGFDENDKKAFMRDYGKYKRSKLLENWTSVVMKAEN